MNASCEGSEAGSPPQKSETSTWTILHDVAQVEGKRCSPSFPCTPSVCIVDASTFNFLTTWSAKLFRMRKAGSETNPRVRPQRLLLPRRARLAVAAPRSFRCSFAVWLVLSTEREGNPYLLSLMTFVKLLGDLRSNCTKKHL